MCLRRIFSWCELSLALALLVFAGFLWGQIFMIPRADPHGIVGGTAVFFTLQGITLLIAALCLRLRTRGFWVVQALPIAAIMGMYCDFSRLENQVVPEPPKPSGWRMDLPLESP